MADNVSVDTADVAPANVATDDIASVHYQRMKVSVGPDGTAVDLSEAAPLPVRDALTQIADGLVTGESIMYAIGERESMGTTAAGEDITRMNELAVSPTSHTLVPTPPDAGERMEVVSESASDAAAGTGIRTLRIHYLDATGAEQTEDITMDGTTPVLTDATDIRFVQEIHALTVGSGGVAAGHIKINKAADVLLVYNMIALGGNQSLVPHRMVPLGKRLILKAWHAEEGQQKRILFRIRSTDKNGVLLPGVFLFKGVCYLRGTTSCELDLNIEVPALSIVKISGWPDQVSAEGGCGWWGVLKTD